MTTLHMDTDIVRALANQMKQSVDAIRCCAQSLNNSTQNIDWFGPSRDEFVMETGSIIRQLDAQSEVGGALAGRVVSEVAEWENAASSFGMDAGQIQAIFKHLREIFAAPLLFLSHLFVQRPPYITRSPIDSAPQNMQELARSVTDLYGTGTPIRAIKIGVNEYLILVTGSESGTQANNWNSAGRSGLGLESDYQGQLKGVLMGLPAGAIVNLAGHSQGGIVSNNVVTDSDVQSHLKIRSVTTFGSPVSAEPQGDIGPDGQKVEYRRYTAVGDIVPLASGEAIDVLVAVQNTIHNPLKVGSVFKEMSDLGQNLIPGQVHWSWNPIEMIKGTVADSHFAYSSENSALKQVTNLPFATQQWLDSDYYYAHRSSAELPILDKPL